MSAFLENLERGSFLRLRIFIEKISRIRSAQGFRLSEVQRAYYLFYEVITPILQYLNIKGEINEDTIKEVDGILIEMLFELSESYHKRLNEKMEEYIKEMEDANLKLKEISIKDELTGCYNFRYFKQVLDLEIARSNRYKRPLSLIIFDIDHFKKIKVSGGINGLNGNGKDNGRLVSDADKALYLAKRQGRNKVLVSNA